MIQLRKAYAPDGSVRGVWRDSVSKGFRESGAIPQRASRVEVIAEGPNLGKFHVDLSPLSVIASRDDLNVCLVQAFDSYNEAVRSEVAFIERNWVLGTGKDATCRESENR